MLFYCPNCQKEYELEPLGTITTKSGRVAYKATCQVCGQDLAEFIPPAQTPPASPPPSLIDSATPPSAPVTQTLPPNSSPATPMVNSVENSQTNSS